MAILDNTPITLKGSGPGKTQVGITLSENQVRNIIQEFIMQKLDINTFPDVKVSDSISLCFTVPIEKAQELFKSFA